MTSGSSGQKEKHTHILGVNLEEDVNLKIKKKVPKPTVFS